MTKRLKSIQTKQVLVVLFLIVLLLIAFAAGKTYGENNQGSTNSKAIVLVSSTKSQPPAPSKSSTSQQPTQESLKAQAEAKTNSNAVRQRTFPSNGRLSLSGTVDEITDKQLKLKTSNGQLYAVAVDSKTKITGSEASIKSVNDIKQGTRATLIISVRSDGALELRSIRVYKAD